MSEEENSQLPQKPSLETEPKGDIETLPQIEQETMPAMAPTPSTPAPCPVPPEHVKLFEECCTKYEKGEMSDLDVMIEVAKSLKGLKKEE